MLTLYMNFFFVVNAMPENDTLTLVSIVVTVVSIFVTIWTSGGKKGWGTAVQRPAGAKANLNRERL